MTSSPAVNGKLQVVQREVGETKRTAKNVEETKTTVMLPSVNGGLAPALKVHAVRKKDANDTVESQKATLLPDRTGEWQVSEIRQATTRQEGKNRSTEERVSRRDTEGELGEVSRIVNKESKNNSGETRRKPTLSMFPGSTRDGGLHLVEGATTAQRSSPTGEQITEQRVEQPNPGDPSSGLSLTILVNDRMRPGPCGTQAIRNNSDAGLKR